MNTTKYLPILGTEYALEWASYNGYIEIVKLLLAANSPYSDCSEAALDMASVFCRQTSVSRSDKSHTVKT